MPNDGNSATDIFAVTSLAGNDINTTLDFGFINNPPPAINDLAGDTSTFTEDGAAVLLDDSSAPEVAATVTDDQANLNGGSLTAAITGNEVAAEDVLGLSTAGTVTLSDGTNVGSTVSVGGQAIGTVTSDGTGGADLVITFNTADATPANVSTLIQALTYSNSNTLDPSTSQRTIDVTVNDGLSGTATASVLVNVAASNDPPTAVTFANPTTAIDENTDTTTGVKVADIQVADDSLGSETLGLIGADAGFFEIVGTELRLKAGVLNFEARASYSVQVTADDPSVGGSPDATSAVFTVNVNDVNEAPSAGADFSPSAAEDAIDTTVLATLSASDPDLGGGNDGANNFEDLSYAITAGDAGVLFEINGNGQISLAAGKSLDFETAQQHVLTVTVSDGPGLNDTVDVTIDVTDVNEAPSAGADFSVTAAENVNDTTVLATVAASDLDLGGGNDATNDFEDLSYAITAGDAGALFEVNGNGQISLAAGKSLDFETAQQHVLTVTVSDGPGLNDTVDVTIDVSDVNEAPLAGADFSVTAAENVNDTTVLATLSASDPDLGGGNDGANNFEDLSYAITAGDPGALFEIDGNGQISLAAGKSLDFETAQQHVLTVTVSDGPALSDTVEVTINVGDVNDNAPTITTNASQSVAENTTTVAALTSTDPDTVGTNPATFTITGGADQAKFAIVGGNLVFQSAPDFESPTDADTNNTYVVEVTANDGVNSTPNTITVTVTDANDPPVINSGTTGTEAENTPASNVVYDADATDLDSAVTFSLTGADAGLFSINPGTGEVRFIASPDFEAPGDADSDNDYEIIVNADDGSNPIVTRAVTISVTDANDVAPTITTSASQSVAENTTVVAALASTDPDTVGTTPATFSITGGADGARFSIVSGNLVFNPAPNFEAPTDADANNTYVVEVTANDGVNATPKTITVTVTDLNDTPPTITTNAAQSVAENTTVVAALASTDPDTAGTNPATFSITGGADQAKFAISGGSLVFASAPNFETPTDADANNTYVVEVTANDGVNATPKTITVAVTDRNDVAPVITTNAAQSVAENTTVVAALASADADTVGTNPALFSITGGADQAKFAISGGNLALLWQIRFVLLDRRSGPKRDIVDSGAGGRARSWPCVWLEGSVEAVDRSSFFPRLAA